MSYKKWVKKEVKKGQFGQRSMGVVNVKCCCYPDNGSYCCYVASVKHFNSLVLVI